MAVKASASPPPSAGPSGASVVPQGVHFALASRHAERVQVCWFDAQNAPIGERDLQRHTHGIWRHTEPNLPAGTLYGYRVHGPWAPCEGHRFNPAKLLLDPYAREVVGRYDGDDIHLGHRPDAPDHADPRDNAVTALKARVVADPSPAATPGPADRARAPCDVRGCSSRPSPRCIPTFPPQQRGRYAGLGHPAAVAHLKRLGITTVCLMPLAFRADEPRLLKQGLNNHWGYNTIAWSAPESRYASQPDTARDECRAMVTALHAAGLEVVLDVVFNHSAESDELGPTCRCAASTTASTTSACPKRPSATPTGPVAATCSTSTSPLVLRLVMDSLRRWVTDYGIDGFRFDLAPILGRGVAPGHAFSGATPVLPGHRPGPGAVRSPDDRRALGHRPRRLPARRVFHPAGSNGTTASATSNAASGCTRCGTRSRPRPRARRLGAAVPSAARPTAASTSSPPTTVSP